MIAAPWLLCLSHKYPHGNTFLPPSLSFLNAFRKQISSSLTICLWVHLLCTPVLSTATVVPGAPGRFCTLVCVVSPPHKVWSPPTPHQHSPTGLKMGFGCNCLRKGSRSSLAGTQFLPQTFQKCHLCHLLNCSVSPSHLRGHCHLPTVEVASGISSWRGVLVSTADLEAKTLTSATPEQFWDVQTRKSSFEEFLSLSFSLSNFHLSSLR